MRTATLLARRPYSSAVSTIPSAFTRQTLADIRSKLSPLPSLTPSDAPPHTVQSSKPPREAAVLIPLLNIEDTAHILLEVRSSGLRVHAGEVSFPGGKCDSTDETFVETALRESQEELGISPSNVEILGMVDGPEYALGNKSRVWPFVGFLHPSNPLLNSQNNLSILPSLPFTSLKPSADEVAGLIPLPLHALLDTQRQSLHFFRMDPGRPYMKYRITELVHPRLESQAMDLEIWGLSGWFLNRLAWRLGWMEQPRVDNVDY